MPISIRNCVVNVRHSESWQMRRRKKRTLLAKFESNKLRITRITYNFERAKSTHTHTHALNIFDNMKDTQQRLKWIIWINNNKFIRWLRPDQVFPLICTFEIIWSFTHSSQHVAGWRMRCTRNKYKLKKELRNHPEEKRRENNNILCTHNEYD